MASVSAVGDQSKNSIIETLRTRGPLSRAELARMLDLSSPTMTTNVKALIEAGLVLEVGESDNALGRKATLLDFNAAVGYVIGIDVERREVNAALTDLSGNVCASSIRLSSGCTGEELYAHIVSSIDELIELSGIEPNKLLCIGAGVPGVFDVRTGQIKLGSYVAGWNEIRVKERLETRYNTRVMIENNCKTGGLGEKWRGVCQDCGNFIYIDYDVGIGSAVFIGGELYRGINGAAGELGYMAPDRFYLRRSFIEEGALEDEICTHAVGRKLGASGADEFFSLLDGGDPGAISLSNELAVLFGMCIANSVSVLNPEKVVISGKMGIGLLERHRERLVSVVEAHVPFTPELIASELGSTGHVLGAVFMAIEATVCDYRKLIARIKY